MPQIDLTSLESLRPAATLARAIEFKDEGETPEGIPLGKLSLRKSGLPVFPDGRWVTRPEARHVAEYFGVELFEY